jgi:polysaccharide pyruvyl transferase WcaK-like protein
MPKNSKVAILDHLGGGNLGDDATFASIVQNVRARWPDAEVIGLSMSPDDTRARHNVPSYPIRRETWDINYQPANSEPVRQSGIKAALRKFALLSRILKAAKRAFYDAPMGLLLELWFLKKSLKIVWPIDVFIIGGGGQLLDSWGGVWKFPYTILKWVVLAKIAGAQCYVLNVGAGPVKGRLSKLFVTLALSLANYVSFRDEDSRGLAQRVGFARAKFVFPDCVYGFEVPSIDMPKTGEPRQLTIGLSPMAYRDPRRYWEKDEKAYGEFIEQFGEFGSRLIDKDARLRVFSTDISFDAWAVADLTRAIKRKHETIEPEQFQQPMIDGIQALCTQIADVDYVVTCRFHGVVFAHLMNKPVIAISHHRKVRTLMADLELGGYCMDIAHIDVDSLSRMFERLVNDEQKIKLQLARKAALYRDALGAQFDGLFGRGFYSTTAGLAALHGQGV